MKKCSDYKNKTLKLCPPNICKINSNRCILQNNMMDELEEDRLISRYIDIHYSPTQKVQSDNIEDVCQTMWSKDLKIGDRVITCGDSIYDISSGSVPKHTVGTIVRIRHRGINTPNEEKQFKVQFDDYPDILEDITNMYHEHDLRRI
jgi:hypothetical protein